eukprot:764535-Hanusia_phi.AAC.2
MTRAATTSRRTPTATSRSTWRLAGSSRTTSASSCRSTSGTSRRRRPTSASSRCEAARPCRCRAPCAVRCCGDRRAAGAPALAVRAVPGGIQELRAVARLAHSMRSLGLRVGRLSIMVICRLYKQPAAVTVCDHSINLWDYEETARHYEYGTSLTQPVRSGPANRARGRAPPAAASDSAMIGPVNRPGRVIDTAAGRLLSEVGTSRIISDSESPTLSKTSELPG